VPEKEALAREHEEKMSKKQKNDDKNKGKRKIKGKRKSTKMIKEKVDKIKEKNIEF